MRFSNYENLISAQSSKSFSEHYTEFLCKVQDYILDSELVRIRNQFTHCKDFNAMDQLIESLIQEMMTDGKHI